MRRESEIRPLALSGDARWLAVAMLRDGKVPIVRLLDAARLERARLERVEIPDLRHNAEDEDRGPREAVTFATFLDDAPTLLTGTSDGHFRIWGEAKGYAADGVTLEPNERLAFQQAFYSRTHKLLIVHRRDAVELWDLAPGAVDRVARRAAGRNLSVEEWQESLLQRNHQPRSTFPDLPAPVMRKP